VRPGALDKFDPAGKLLWTGAGPFTVFERPAVTSAAVYLTGGQSLYAWDSAGRPQWIYSAPGAIYEVAAHEDSVAVLIETPAYSDRLASWLEKLAPKVAKASEYELQLLTPAGQLQRRITLGSSAEPFGYASFLLNWPPGAFLVTGPDGSVKAYSLPR
jgi:hypothetical protein